MSPDSSVDPRGRHLCPTQEEIDAWAEREHTRRTAWLAGPSEDEKLAWSRRYRWRARLGLEESRLGPSPADVDRWAEAEHKRRAAWLTGPSETEKLARAQSQPSTTEAPAEQEDDAAWAANETQRRQAWLAGPSEQEKREWAESQSRGIFDDLMSLPAMIDADFADTAQHFLRDAELVGKGTLFELSRTPLRLWSHFIRAGRAFEEEFYQQPRRRRVRY